MTSNAVASSARAIIGETSGNLRVLVGVEKKVNQTNRPPPQMTDAAAAKVMPYHAMALPLIPAA